MASPKEPIHEAEAAREAALYADLLARAKRSMSAAPSAERRALASHYVKLGSASYRSATPRFGTGVEMASPERRPEPMPEPPG